MNKLKQVVHPKPFALDAGVEFTFTFLLSLEWRAGEFALL